MYKLDCSYIKTSGRVDCNQKLFVIGYLAGNDDFLLISAGQGTCRRFCTASRTHIKFLNQFFCMLFDGFPIQNTMGRIGFFLKMLQNQVVLIGELQNQAMFLTVCRNTGNTTLKSLLWCLIEDIFAKHGHFSGVCFPESGQYFYQLRLSVSIYTCQANNLTASDIQMEAFQDLDTTIILCMKVFDIKNHFARLLIFLVDFEVYVTAYHHGCQLIFIDVCYLHRLNVFTLTDNGTVIGGCGDLL